MKNLRKFFTTQKALAFLAFFIVLAVKAPVVSALSLTDLLSQPKVLGDSISNPYPYSTASLVNDGGTIYFISGTTKVPFTSLKAFTGLGYSLRNVVKGDLSNYVPSQSYVISTANAEHPWGSWISYKGVVYYSSQDGLIGVPSAEIFLSNGGKWNLVVKANKYDIAVLSSKGNQPVLTDSDSRVVGQPTLTFGNPGTQNNLTIPIPVTVNPPATGTTSTTTAISFIPQVVLPANVYASTTATFSAPSADPNLPLAYNFAWDDGTPTNSLTASYAVHTYYIPGLYMFSVSVTDGLGNTYSTTVPLTVVLPPNTTPSVPQFSLPSGIIVGGPVTFSASSGDPQSLPFNLYFSWGDGKPNTLGTNNSATHVYTTSGFFLVTVTATNTQGFSSSASNNIYIAP